MSRSVLLVFLLIILIITSQFEWRQQLVSDIDAIPSVSQKQLQVSNREAAVKEKIILSQERNIQRLTELVQSLRRQLEQCRGNNATMKDIATSLKENIVDLNRQSQSFLED